MTSRSGMLVAGLALVAIPAWTLADSAGSAQAAPRADSKSQTVITGAANRSLGLKVVRPWTRDPLAVRASRTGGAVRRGRTTPATLRVGDVVGGKKRFRGAGRRVARRGARIIIGPKVVITKRGEGRVRLDDLRVDDRLTVKGRFVTPGSRRARRVPTFRAKRIIVRAPAASRGTQPGTTSPPATTPPSGNPPAPVPSPAGFPTAATTGVPAGTALTPSGSITVNTPGTVIDSRDIQGTVTINANDVTLKRSRINGSGFALVRVKDGATGVRIEDVEINGRGTAGEGNSMGVFGPATVVRANVYGVENGLTPFTGSVLRDNYVHDLAAPGAPHYDGIQMDGGIRDVTIEHNTIDMSDHDQTAAVMIDNGFGPIDNITVNNNRLLGGGYTVYSDAQFSGGSITNVTFSNNRLGRGYWGYSVIRGNTVVWTNNVDDRTGRPVR